MYRSLTCCEAPASCRSSSASPLVQQPQQQLAAALLRECCSALLLLQRPQQPLQPQDQHSVLQANALQQLPLLQQLLQSLLSFPLVLSLLLLLPPSSKHSQQQPLLLLLLCSNCI